MGSTTGITCGAGDVYNSESPELYSCFMGFKLFSVRARVRRTKSIDVPNTKVPCCATRAAGFGAELFPTMEVSNDLDWIYSPCTVGELSPLHKVFYIVFALTGCLRHMHESSAVGILCLFFHAKIDTPIYFVLFLL